MAKFWKNNKGFISGIFILFFLRSAVADWYHVPSGSMQPNVLIGDRVWVNKLAFDVKIPFTDFNLYRHAEPKVGEVVVFQSQKADERLIKRVIGVPGDKVAMVNNHLLVNGEPVDIEFLQTGQPFDSFLKDRDQADYYTESHQVDLSQSENTQGKPITHFPIRLSKHAFPGRNSFNEIEVPPDYLWVMGDNRDNSADSRVIGLVPRSELIGRAERVVISFDANEYYMPRRGRFWIPLEGE